MMDQGNEVSHLKVRPSPKSRYLNIPGMFKQTIVVNRQKIKRYSILYEAARQRNASVYEKTNCWPQRQILQPFGPGLNVAKEASNIRLGGTKKQNLGRRSSNRKTGLKSSNDTFRDIDDISNKVDLLMLLNEIPSVEMASHRLSSETVNSTTSEDAEKVDTKDDSKLNKNSISTQTNTGTTTDTNTSIADVTKYKSANNVDISTQISNPVSSIQECEVKEKCRKEKGPKLKNIKRYSSKTGSSTNSDKVSKEERIKIQVQQFLEEHDSPIGQLDEKLDRQRKELLEKVFSLTNEEIEKYVLLKGIDSAIDSILKDRNKKRKDRLTESESQCSGCKPIKGWTKNVPKRKTTPTLFDRINPNTENYVNLIPKSYSTVLKESWLRNNSKINPQCDYLAVVPNDMPKNNDETKLDSDHNDFGSKVKTKERKSYQDSKGPQISGMGNHRINLESTESISMSPNDTNALASGPDENGHAANKKILFKQDIKISSNSKPNAHSKFRARNDTVSNQVEINQVGDPLITKGSKQSIFRFHSSKEISLDPKDSIDYIIRKIASLSKTSNNLEKNKLNKMKHQSKISGNKLLSGIKNMEINNNQEQKKHNTEKFLYSYPKSSEVVSEKSLSIEDSSGKKITKSKNRLTLSDAPTNETKDENFKKMLDLHPPSKVLPILAAMIPDETVRNPFKHKFEMSKPKLEGKESKKPFKRTKSTVKEIKYDLKDSKRFRKEDKFDRDVKKSDIRVMRSSKKEYENLKRNNTNHKLRCKEYRNARKQSSDNLDDDDEVFSDVSKPDQGVRVFCEIGTNTMSGALETNSAAHTIWKKKDWQQSVDAVQKYETFRSTSDGSRGSQPPSNKRSKEYDRSCKYDYSSYNLPPDYKKRRNSYFKSDNSRHDKRSNRKVISELYKGNSDLESPKKRGFFAKAFSRIVNIIFDENCGAEFPFDSRLNNHHHHHHHHHRHHRSRSNHKKH